MHLQKIAAGKVKLKDVTSYADELGWPLLHSGKVRELYAIPGNDEAILMVATDTISAFDHILEVEIPDKGAVLTQLSCWWFEHLDDVIDNHLISTDVPECVEGRACVVEKLDMIMVECVARGYLTGSGWIEYQKTGTVTGIELPPGLHDGSKLKEPIFTPAIKAPYGEHDMNVDFETMCESIGSEELGYRLRTATLEIYQRAESIARKRGIIIADTKFEFGLRKDGTLVLADEVLTPDSSRFWDLESWKAGKLESFDKQFVRNWLLDNWDPTSGEVPPTPPADIVEATRQRYLEAFLRLTGKKFEATKDRL